MAKLNKGLCFFLLLLVVLTAFGCQRETAAPEPVVSAVYWNMSAGEMPEADPDGAYTLKFVCDGQQVLYRCSDAELVENICLQDVLGLELEGNTITGMIYMYDMPYQWSAWDYCVQSMGGKQVKLNSERGLNGGEVMVTVTEQTKIYNVSALTENPGEAAQLQKYDGVTVLSNSDGEAQIIFVSDRPYKPDTEKAYCQHCEQDVIWNAWVGAESMPSAAGHYRLETDVTLKNSFNLGGGKICIDLNGKRVEQTLDGVRIYNMTGAMELTIMDSVGTAVIRSTGAESNGGASALCGMVVNMQNTDAVLNLYSGTLDGSGNPVQYGGVICCLSGTFNMHGGTILGSDPWSTGSGAVCANGTFNMYGGRIVGGKQMDIGYPSTNPKGGAVMTIRGGTFNMYGGSIEGGESPFAGGSIQVMSGTVNLAGGTITGGKSNVMGSGIYLRTGTLKISGSINITGNDGDNVCIGYGGKLEIDEAALDGARVGISMEMPGELTDCTSDTVLDCLFSDDPSHRLVIRDGKLILE